MSGLINFYEELRLKLQAGITAGAIEVAHSVVHIGPRELIYKDNDYPSICIIPVLGSGNPEYMRYGQTEEVETEVLYVTSKETDDYNKLYDSNGDGALRNLEQIINYIHYDRTLETFTDLNMNNTSYDPIKYSYRIGYDYEGKLHISVTIRNKIAAYTRGQL